MAEGIRVLVRLKPDRKSLQLVYVCPLTGRDITKSAKTSDWKEAERQAALWQAEVEAGKTPGRVSWDLFCERFRDEYLADKQPASRRPYNAALALFEKVIGSPKSLTAIDSSTMSRFAAGLRDEVPSPATAAKTLRHCKVALRWAHRLGMLDRVPHIPMPKLDKTRSAKGRPLTDAEFAKFLKAVPKVVGKEHAPGWTFLLRGLWASGLRLEEAAQLSWDSPPVRIQSVAGRFPCIEWHAQGQKSRRDDVTPITPDFWELLATIPKAKRKGPVFPLTLEKHRLAFDTRSKTISAIGKAAGIVTGRNGKHASAHDLRRSFGTRWARKVMPAILKVLMRHADISTTLSYYVDIEAEDIGSAIWGQSVPHAVPRNGRQRKTAPQKTRKN